MRLVHAHGHGQSGPGGEGGDRPDGGGRAVGVGEDAGEQGADGEASVAPQAVDPDGAGAPGGVGDVADGGEQGGVDQGGADAEQDLGRRPDEEGGAEGDQGYGNGLSQHPGGDQVFATDAVGPPPGEQLTEAPDRGVERGEYADRRDGLAAGGEQQREDAPGQRVVEVVDHAGPARGGQGSVAQAGDPGDLAGGQLGVVVGVGRGGVAGSLGAGVAPCLPDGEGGQAEGEGGVGGAEQERDGPQSRVCGDGAGGQGGGGQGEVAGGLVEAHGQAAAAGSDQVDLHDDGGGPGQALVDAEQHVREHDPAPRGSVDQQCGHGQCDQPAGDEHGLAPVAVGQGAGEEVGDRLGRAEGGDVGQCRCIGGEVEDIAGEQRQDGAFLTERAADQGIDRDQEGELGEVGAQPEADAAGFGQGGVGRRHRGGLGAGGVHVRVWEASAISRRP